MCRVNGESFGFGRLHTSHNLRLDLESLKTKQHTHHTTQNYRDIPNTRPPTTITTHAFTENDCEMRMISDATSGAQ